MSLLNSDTTVEVNLYYELKKTPEGFNKIKVYEKDEGKKKFEEQKELEEDKKTVEVLKTKWKVLNWKEQNQVTSNSTYFNQMEGVQDIDFFKYRDQRIKACLVSWDLKDAAGKQVPVHPNMIDQLPAEVVYGLVSEYDRIVNLTEEDEGK